MDGFEDDQKIELYGVFGGTALYLQQIQKGRSGRADEGLITRLRLEKCIFIQQI
jgi:hypothetical protein